MSENVFIATTGKGLARASKNGTGNWSVNNPLPDTDVRSLAADLHNTNIIFAGTQGQGVFRSDDRGGSWRPSGLDGTIIKSLAVSPTESGTIFAGTKSPATVFVSRDGGENWAELEGFRRIGGRRFWFSPAEKPFSAYVQAVAPSPTDPSVIMAGIEFGATVRSEDGGKTWSGHMKNTLRDCHSLKFHHSNGNWIYEAGGSGGGATVSQDGGRTWRKFKSGLAKNYGVSCAADPERPEVWYVSVAPGPSKAYGEEAEAYLYRADGGADWQAIGWEPQPMKHMPMELVTVPDAPGHIYAGTVGGHVYHSVDYGDSWDKLPFNLGGVWRTMIII